jgi:dipeptidyl aminopeptidase/acylaminoacyl peptidase
MITRKLVLPFLMFVLGPCLLLSVGAEKPKITLDEFFNYVNFNAVKMSPDGTGVVLAAQRADWDQNLFRGDLWLYRDDGHGANSSLMQLTQSGRDSDPQWSPDGKWIAFLSERKSAGGRDSDAEGADSKDKEVNQLYLISAAGGEAFPITQGEEEVHAFGWSADSKSLYFATRELWAKEQKDAYKKEWKDTIQYREAERGDTIFALDLAAAINRHQNSAAQITQNPEKAGNQTQGSHAVAKTPWRVQQIIISPDAKRLAFSTSSISERQEKIEEFELYLVELANAAPDRAPRQITKNNAIEQDLHWAPDSRHLFFALELGSVEAAYEDVQPRLYAVDVENGSVERWAKDFEGAIAKYTVRPDGSVLVSARIGTEVQFYTQSNASAPLVKQAGWPGTYASVTSTPRSSRVAFVYSSLERPEEIYLAENAAMLKDARPITSFNKLFSERDLPRGKPYRWKSDDGTPVEGMLLYPPGKFEATNLPMLTLIHGGPADADGNHFEADWYQWDRLAASNGWLVFEPNYRGSTGYGDKFLRGIVPEIVSRPGKDILAGVDALVKEGIADSEHLVLGGYSYGGYMTNWLITQTTRFKAAVTGAGAVEHVGNWGNDDTTFDDAYFLGGRPWEAAQRYHDEAAIYQIDKVRTPTHMVAGADDIRVAVLEDYLLDHALHSLGVPSTLLVFPGEGHSLSKNPWHGKIKVREELKWLQKYGRVPAGN